MKRVIPALCLLAFVAVAATGCIHDKLTNACVVDVEGLSGNCDFDLNDLVDGLRDRLGD